MAEHFFLSYSRSDTVMALRFAQDLRAGGAAIWVDQWDIRPSQHWDRAIEQAVRDCTGLLVLLSPRSAASENVADEISFAIENGKKVIPIVIEKCVVPLRVTRMQMLDATVDYSKVVRDCLSEMLRGAPASVQGADMTPASTAAFPGSVAEPFRGLICTEPELKKIAEALVAFMGPLAPVIVKRDASVSVTRAELEERLAQRLPQEDRALFLQAVGALRA